MTFLFTEISGLGTVTFPIVLLAGLQADAGPLGVGSGVAQKSDVPPPLPAVPEPPEPVVPPLPPLPPLPPDRLGVLEHAPTTRISAQTPVTRPSRFRPWERGAPPVMTVFRM
jgi:hypothetical protein